MLSSIAAFAAACLLALTAGVAGCAARTPRAATGDASSAGTGAATTLRLLGAAVYPAGALAVPGGPRVGSLSGLAYDAASGEWIGASDDTVQPRLVWMRIGLGPELTVTPTHFTFLRPGPGVSAAAIEGLEPESMVILPGGGFATTLEGYHDTANIVHQPAVVFVDRAGTVTGVVHPRPHVLITAGDRTRGVRHNVGLESLTRAPDGRLLSGTEQPLAQDGPMSTAARGGVVRLMEFVPGRGGAWAPGREWAYQLEPTQAVAGYGPPCEDGENGLSDMLALSNDRWLTLERACLLAPDGGPAFNPVRVFEVSTAGADDVSALLSLAGRQPRLVTKRLVLDVATLVPRLPPLMTTGSNFEGLAFGPPGPRGERTVVLISDDNFRPSQTTAFLWLALP